MKTIHEAKHAFQPVGKLDQTTQIKIMHVQKGFEDLANDILDKVPECEDRTHAIRQLLDSKFWCVQAITHAQVQAPEKKVDKK